MLLFYTIPLHHHFIVATYFMSYLLILFNSPNLRHMGDNDELYFRDYLNAHPEISKEYEEMKLKLWKEYEHNRDGYTDAKTKFISKYTKEAKKIYGNRYCSIPACQVEK